MKLLILLLFIFGTVKAQSPKNLMDLYAKDGLDKGIGSPFNGTVLVAKKDSILLKKSYGYSDFKTKSPLKIDSKFLIGSITKQFTALLILQEIEKGTITLETNLTDILSYFPKEKGKKLTIQRLLTHTSGLPHYEGIRALGYSLNTFSGLTLTPTEYAQLIGKVDLIYTPDTRFYYSSSGYILLGVVLEEITRQSYSQLIKNRITDPLGLINTGYSSNQYIKKHIVNDFIFKEFEIYEGFFNEYEGTYTLAPFRDQSTTYSTGGLHSTVEDLFKWVKALKSNKLLSSKYTKSMFTTNTFGYNYGWFRNPETMFRRNPSAKLFVHGGKISGYNAEIALYDDETTIIYLSNVSELNNEKLTRFLHLGANGFEAKSFKRNLVRPEIEESISDFIQDGGLVAYEDYYKELSIRAGYTIHPSAHAVAELITLYTDKKEIQKIIESHLKNGMIKTKREMNILGYALLDKKCYDLAIKIFRENTQLFPLSATTYYHLAEAYITIGDKIKAKRYFKKAYDVGKRISSRSLNEYKKRYEEIN